MVAHLEMLWLILNLVVLWRRGGSFEDLLTHCKCSGSLGAVLTHCKCGGSFGDVVDWWLIGDVIPCFSGMTLFMAQTLKGVKR